MSARMASGEHGGGRARLTNREHQVVRLLALGLTYEQVAHELGISRLTVGRLRSDAGAKHGGGALVDLLRELGWLRVPNPRHPEHLHG